MAEPLFEQRSETGGLAAIMARKGADAARIGDALGISMPAGPRVSFGGDRTVIGTGPGTWLLKDENGKPDFAQDLARDLAGLASVSDQSSGYALFRLSGPDARTVLQRGAPVDFHPSRFEPGSVATTVIAHIGVIVWQTGNEPTYECAVFRSLSDSFRHWLDQTAAAL